MKLLKSGFARGGLLGVVAAAVVLLAVAVGVRSLPSDRAGLLERLCSLHSSVREGRLMALPSQTGYQMAALRGAIAFLLWRCLCCVLCRLQCASDPAQLSAVGPDVLKGLHVLVRQLADRRQMVAMVLVPVRRQHVPEAAGMG